MNVTPEAKAFLQGQLKAARLVLFTGAGFSAGAQDRTGKNLPVGDVLAREIWDICFPGEPYDDSSNLADLYQTALVNRRSQLQELLERRLTVNAGTLPDFYRVWFSVPWKRTYTLNIDDLAAAAARKFTLPRTPVAVSGTTDPHKALENPGLSLEVIHLNGTLDDLPDKVTFSVAQYGRRLASQEPAYHRLVSDLAAHPFIFVGTKLDESILWQHIELRGERGVRGLKELRPQSFLISRSLSRPRQQLLRQYNVEWLEGDAEAFAEVLASLTPAAEQGLRRIVRARPPKVEIQPVSDLVAAANTTAPSLYLLGSEPDWSDLVTGRASQRACESDLRALADGILKSQDGAKPADAASLTKVLLVTGTAGAGKSTSLMRLAMGLSASGRPVAWVGSDADVAPRDIRTFARRVDGPPVIAIDEADRYGTELSGILNDLQHERRVRLVAIAMRATRIDKTLPAGRLNVASREFAIPVLADGDITGLLRVLDEDNKLGILKGLPLEKRIAAFRDQAGRQLLVAMMQATSGQKFEEKIVAEWEQLQPLGQSVYALVALGSAFKTALTRDEILLGVGALGEGSEGNETLNALSDLTRRHVLLVGDDGNSCRARHRRIAEVLVEELHRSGRLGSVHVRLAFVAATRVDQAMPRHTKEWRLLKMTINHQYLFKMLGLDDARSVYQAIEQLLSWDYHYLLQRGCTTRTPSTRGMHGSSTARGSRCSTSSRSCGGRVSVPSTFT